MLRIIRSADYPARLWKNGAGTTRDIVVSPPGASLDDFDFRLSLAHVDRNGPFSRFDGVDRTLVLLNGAMTLHEPERRIDLVRDVPVAFEGERSIEATLAGGSTLDFNVMTRRGRARHTVRRETLSKRTNIEPTRGSTIILFVLDGGVSVDGELLDVHDTAVISTQSVAVAASAETASALVVEIRPNVL